MTTQDLADIMRPGTNRGLDFVTIEELCKRTGVTSEAVLPFALSEMLCNALDKDATQVSIDIQKDSGFDKLTISDNGSKKLSDSDIELILDFENKASSKRGFLRVSRGYLGNALKCVFGYSHALAEARGMMPPEITIESGSCKYRVLLKPDRIRATINHEKTVMNREDDGYTSFTVKFPNDDKNESSIQTKLRDIIHATSMVNNNRKISFNLYGEQGSFGVEGENRSIRRETSIAWYTLKQFTELFEDFFRASSDSQLKDFIAMFRGSARRNAIRDILQDINASNRDSQSTNRVQFVPTFRLGELMKQDIQKLFLIMKSKSKPINTRSIPSVLGFVGQENFIRLQKANRWAERPRYTILKDTASDCPDPNLHLFTHSKCKNPDHVEYPYLIELTVFERNDTEGLKVYSCVNFMASTELIFSRAFDVKYRLDRVGIREDHHITVLIHLVSPVLKWLNYGKNMLDDNGIGDLLEKAFDKILPIPKTPREYHPKPPPRPLSWVPHGKLGDSFYETRLQAFATELKTIETLRTYPIKPGSRGWCYLLEEFEKINKGEFGACQKAINDCRKTGLLPMDFVGEDQDETRHFRGIHRASSPIECLKQMREDVAEMRRLLPSKMTHYWKGEKYFLIMVVEKYEILNIADQVNRDYHLPSTSSKGWMTLHIRNNIAKLCKWAEAQGLIPVLLLFYDLDYIGWKITKKFRKNLKDMERGTHWNPDNLIIERIGLNKEDIDKYGLTWIDNLKTASGREPRPGPSLCEYLRLFGHRKCEANALFKSDETLKVAEQIFRNAIEKWLGSDARERFRKKEEESIVKLKQQGVYDDPVWDKFDAELIRLEKTLAAEQPKEEEAKSTLVQEKEVEVYVDGNYCGQCPRCGKEFNYGPEDAEKVLLCRNCHALMRIKFVT